MSRVPGTFKNRPILRRDLSPQGVEAESLLTAIAGALHAERWLVGDCTVMCAREPFGAPGEWRWHVSIAHPTRYPDWDEIKTAVFGIPELALVEGRTFAQLLGGPVRDGEWVNAHENCFHFYEIDDPWRGGPDSRSGSEVAASLPAAATPHTGGPKRSDGDAEPRNELTVAQREEGPSARTTTGGHERDGATARPASELGDSA